VEEELTPNTECNIIWSPRY